MATLQDLLGGGLPAGLLDAEQMASAEQRARNSGLLNLAFGLLQASQGQPGQRKPGLGQIIGQAGPVGLQGYQQSFDKTLKDAVTSMQIAEMQRKQKTAEQLRKIAPTLIQEQREPGPITGAFDAAQGLDVMQGGMGAVQQPRVTGYGINTAALPALAALGPEGMEYAKNLADFQRALAPKTSVQTIYDPQGREVKVRYNEETGDYTPLGGSKAEPFVQVDRGNVIELRRPTTGEVVGTLQKGAAPSATPYEMTDYGKFNKATGKLEPITDSQGNQIQANPAAKASDGERNAAGFYMRMVDASQTINQPLKDAQGKPLLDKDGKPVTLSAVAEKPEFFAELVGGILPNWMGGRQAQNTITSAARQQYQQAQENWVTANLRKESGAVIGVDEMKQEIRKYFPQLGDSQKVVDQKTEARKVVEDAMRRNAGRALSIAPQQSRNVNVNY